MTDCIDLWPSMKPKPAPVTVRKAVTAPLATGAKSLPESLILTALRSGPLGTESAIRSATALSEAEVHLALRSLEGRDLVRRHVNSFGGSSIVAK